MTLAPEVPGALDLLGALRRRGAVGAAGHSEATEPEILAALDAGLSHATHLYCAMSTISKQGPRRIPGLLETALASDRLTTEVIADGHHLAPALLTIAARAKGAERLLLVTDAMRGAGMPDGVYAFGPPNGSPAIVEGGVARTPDNTGFASSTARTCDLVRNMVSLAGCTLAGRRADGLPDPLRGPRHGRPQGAPRAGITTPTWCCWKATSRCGPPSSGRGRVPGVSLTPKAPPGAGPPERRPGVSSYGGAVTPSSIARAAPRRCGSWR